jgi:amidase
MARGGSIILIGLAALALGGRVQAASAPDPTDLTLAQMQARMDSGQLTSEQLVRAYLARIARLDRSGPDLHALIAVNPEALAQARALDRERRAKGARGPLHGVPVVLKDNIESADPMATTAGSRALKDNLTGRDAPLAARLRAAGAVIIGKANLSEWANFRSRHSVSGWSAMGGLARNPYVLDRSACGSSAGSAVAVSARLAAAAVGTETDGSLTCPGSIDGVVSLKPTLGLVSRSRIVPISHSQDTAGPMGRSVADVAALLTVMAGSDPADPATAQADARRTDYLAALGDGGALRGKRIGVIRFEPGARPEVDPVYEAALATLRAAGATLVEVKLPPRDQIGKDEQIVLAAEFKADLAAYLATAAPAVKVRTVDDVIAFDAADPVELSLFGQDNFEAAAKAPGLDDPAYRAALEESKRLAGPEGLDRLLAAERLDVLVAPTSGPAWRVDVVLGDRYSGGFSGMAAVAGYPHLTVPMGQTHGLPLGISFIGPAWSDAQLLAMGYAFEQQTHARREPHFLRGMPGE